MSSDPFRPLPRFDPARSGVLTRIRVLPATALTIASVIVPMLVVVYLAADKRRWDLFQLPGPLALWALAATAIAVAVGYVCRKRPGNTLRLLVPRLWSFCLMIAGLIVAFLGITMTQIPGWLHVFTFAFCWATVIFAMRLVPLPPLHSMVQWIGLVVLIPVSCLALVAATSVADSLIRLRQRQHADLSAALGNAAMTLERRAPMQWRKGGHSEEAGSVVQHLQGLEEPLNEVNAAIVRKDIDLQRIGLLGPDARAKIKRDATRLIDILERAATPPEGIEQVRRPNPSSEAQIARSDETQQLVIGARRTYYREMSGKLRALVQSEDFKQLSRVFNSSDEVRQWDAELAQVAPRIDQKAQQFEESWDTYWLGRALRGQSMPPSSPRQLLALRFDRVGLTGSETATTTGLRVGALEQWADLTFANAQRLVDSSPTCNSWMTDWATRERACDSGRYWHPQRYAMACQLHADADGQPPLITIMLKYESKVDGDEYVDCTGDNTSKRRIFRNLYRSDTPLTVDLDFRVPAKESADAFAARLMEEVEAQAREINAVALKAVKLTAGRLLQYKPATARGKGATMQISATPVGQTPGSKGADIVRVRVRRG
jgi:hypothetical protein